MIECKWCHRIGCACGKPHKTRAEDCCNYFEIDGIFYIKEEEKKGLEMLCEVLESGGMSFGNHSFSLNKRM